MQALVKLLILILKGLLSLLDPDEILDDLEAQEKVDTITARMRETRERRNTPRDKPNYQYWITLYFESGQIMKKPLGTDEYCIRDDRVFLKSDGKCSLLEDVVGFNCYKLD